MTAKEYLMQIRRNDILIEQKMNERASLKKYDISAVRYDEERVMTNPSGESPQARLIEKLSDYDEEISMMIGRFYDLKMTAIKQIQSLPRLEYVQLLYKRYVEYKSLEQISVEMKYNYDYIRRMHGYALNIFGKMFL